MAADTIARPHTLVIWYVRPAHLEGGFAFLIHVSMRSVNRLFLHTSTTPLRVFASLRNDSL